MASLQRGTTRCDSAGSIDARVPGEKYAVDAHADAGATPVSVPIDSSSARKIRAHGAAGHTTIRC